MNSRLITLLAICFTLTVSCKDAQSGKTNGDQQGKPDFKPAPVVQPGNGNGAPNFNPPAKNPSNDNDDDRFGETDFDACYQEISGRLRIINPCPSFDERTSTTQKEICTQRDQSGRCVGTLAQCQIQFSREAKAQVYFCSESNGNNNGGTGLQPGIPNQRPGQGNPGQGFPGQGNPGQGFPGQGNPGQGFPGQGFPGQGFPGQGFPGQGNPGQGFPGQGNPGQGFPGQPVQGPGQGNPNGAPLVRYPSNPQQGPGVIMPGTRW